MFGEAIKLSAKNKQAENPAYHCHLELAYEKAEKLWRRQHFERALTQVLQ